MEKLYYMGIDPGISGGLAVVDSDGILCEAVKFKDKTFSDINEHTLLHKIKFCLLEKVSSQPGEGVVSSFTFGQSFGFLQGLLVANKIKHDLITPMKWQAPLGLIQRGRKLTKTQKKNANKQKAQRLFPDHKMTHAIADAVLLAYLSSKMKG